MRCPLCDKEFSPESSSAMPFCCDRCRLIDLGRWLDEKQRLPVRARGGRGGRIAAGVRILVVGEPASRLAVRRRPLPFPVICRLSFFLLLTAEELQSGNFGPHRGNGHSERSEESRWCAKACRRGPEILRCAQNDCPWDFAVLLLLTEGNGGKWAAMWYNRISSHSPPYRLHSSRLPPVSPECGGKAIVFGGRGYD